MSSILIPISRPLTTPPTRLLGGYGARSGGGGGGAIVFEDTFATGIDPTWQPNTSGVTNTTWESGDGGFARVNYNNTEFDYGINYYLEEDGIEEVYIKLLVRQNTVADFGPKHLKIFGKGVSGTESNLTFGMLGYGNEYGVYYGDAATGSNDNQCEFHFDGTVGGGSSFERTPPTVDLAQGNLFQELAVVHRFDYRVRFNTDDTPDGLIEVRHNTVPWFRLVNVYNRANGAQSISNIGIGQYMNFGGTGSPNFTRDYMYFGLSYNGWIA